MATHDGPCRGHGRHRRGSQRELPILFFSTDIGMVGIVAASHPEPFSCFFSFLIVHGPLPNLYVDLAFFREQKAPYKCETVPETHFISETLMVFAVGGQLGILLAVHQSPACSTVHPCLWHSTLPCGTVHPLVAQHTHVLPALLWSQPSSAIGSPWESPSSNKLSSYCFHPTLTIALINFIRKINSSLSVKRFFFVNSSGDVPKHF